LFELRPDTLDAASTTIITGPSKTADIEGLLVVGVLVMGVLVVGVLVMGVLVTGVHGPAEVEIVLVG
jgi:L-lactate utilization protein LutC